ncbi:MAG: hypothetical protein AB8B67_04940 [Rickettsiaceae bacterium]
MANKIIHVLDAMETSSKEYAEQTNLNIGIEKQRSNIANIKTLSKFIDDTKNSSDKKISSMFRLAQKKLEGFNRAMKNVKLNTPNAHSKENKIKQDAQKLLDDIKKKYAKHLEGDKAKLSKKLNATTKIINKKSVALNKELNKINNAQVKLYNQFKTKFDKLSKKITEVTDKLNNQNPSIVINRKQNHRDRKTLDNLKKQLNNLHKKINLKYQNIEHSGIGRYVNTSRILKKDDNDLGKNNILRTLDSTPLHLEGVTSLHDQMLESNNNIRFIKQGLEKSVQDIDATLKYNRNLEQFNSMPKYHQKEKNEKRQNYRSSSFSIGDLNTSVQVAVEGLRNANNQNKVSSNSVKKSVAKKKGPIIYRDPF